MRMRSATAFTIVTVLGMTLAAAQPPAAKSSAATSRPAARVDLSKYPAPVRATIEAETKNATIKKVTKETKKGQVQYEVETIVNGHTRDFNVDPSGKILVDEEEIALDAAPAAVRDALKPYAKVVRLEKVTQNGRTTYEASVQAKNGKRSSLELDANGKRVKG